MAVACSIAFIALRIAMSEGLGSRAPTLILLAAPLVASWFGGWGPGLLATLLCTVIGELALTQPGEAFGWPNSADEWGRVVLLFAYGSIFSAFNESRLRTLRIASARQENLLRAQQELALREQRMRETLEASPAAMVVVNREGRIELVNSQAERMFGWDREKLVGQPIDLLVPETTRHQHAAHRASFHDKPSARLMGAGRDLRARRADGTEFPAEVGLTPLQGASSGLVLATVTDISSRIEVTKSVCAPRTPFMAER
jgi:PAS domain S-box-containing protein